MTNRILLAAFAAAIAVPAVAQTAAAPQPISRAAYMQRIDSAFVAIDSNKDGSTDKAELEAAQTRALTQRKAQLLRDREAAFRRMDSNKDGSLNLQEYNSALSSAPMPKPNAAPILTRLDSNKDGKVSLAENRTPKLAEFDRADANKDGQLTADELARSRRR